MSKFVDGGDAFAAAEGAGVCAPSQLAANNAVRKSNIRFIGRFKRRTPGATSNFHPGRDMVWRLINTVEFRAGCAPSLSSRSERRAQRDLTQGLALELAIRFLWVQGYSARN